MLQAQPPITGFPSVSLNQLMDFLQEYRIRTDGIIGRAIKSVEKNYRNHRRVSGNLTLDEHLRPVTVEYVRYMWDAYETDCSAANARQTKPDHSEEGVAAALLHDTLEDIMGISRGQFSQEFGKDVLYRVAKVTNIRLYIPDDRLERQRVNELMLEQMRMLNLSDSRDWSVLVLKMSDILNASQTLPLPHNPDKEQHVVDKLFKGRIELIRANSTYFSREIATQLSRIPDLLERLGYDSSKYETQPRRCLTVVPVA